MIKKFNGPTLSLQEWRVLFALAITGKSAMRGRSHFVDNLLRKVGAAIGFDETSGQYINNSAWGTDVSNPPQ